MSKVSFIKDIYQSAVEHQSREIEKTIINQSSLTSMLFLKYGEIRHVTRNRYNPFVRDLNLDDIKVKKVINSSFWEVDEASFSQALNFLSVNTYQVFDRLILLKGKRWIFWTIQLPFNVHLPFQPAIQKKYILLAENHQKFLTNLPLPSKGW